MKLLLGLIAGSLSAQVGPMFPGPGNSSGGNVPPTFLTHTYSQNQSATNTTSPINTTGATLIVVFVSSAFLSSPTPTDSAVNVWTQVSSSQLFYCINPTTSSSHTFSVTNSAPNTGFNTLVWVMAFSGTFTALDTSTLFVSSPSYTYSTLAPSNSGELIIGSINAFLLSWTGSLALSSPSFSVVDPINFAITGTNQCGALAYYVAPNTSGIAPTWAGTGLTDLGDNHSGILAAFK